MNEALPRQVGETPAAPRYRTRAGAPWVASGARVEADGVNFSLFSRHATRVEL